MKVSGGDTRPAPLRLGPAGGYWRVVVIAVLLGATLALHAQGSHTLDAIRGGVTLAFMAAGPGMAIMGLLRLDDLLLELSLALALSLVLETIIAMAMLILKHWIPSDGLLTVEVLTAIGALAQVVQVQKLKRRSRYQHTPT